MLTAAQVLARTLREAGVTRMFGLPGGEILDFIEAARCEGIEFVLTRDEGTAAFMADVTGQIERRASVCVATLGPGAVNMTLGVANAYLERSPVIAVTASLARSSEPYATHQKLDLNAVYRPFTKMAITLDGKNTAANVREAIRVSMEPRMGPVHIGLPSDVARSADVVTDETPVSITVPAVPPASSESIEEIAAEIRRAKRPIVILGLDLDPYTNAKSVRAFVEHLGVPTFVTPKAKGMLPEDHPLFFGVCAGVAGDSVIVDLFSRADLLIGVGFEPVESDKLWHHTMKLVSVGPMSIAEAEYHPHREAVGDVNAALEELRGLTVGPFSWTDAETSTFRQNLVRILRPAHEPGPGLSPSEAIVRLRQAAPRDTILVTDVGSIKSVTSQCWSTFSPLTFFESNGLSSMGYGFSGAMAAKLLFPDRPVVCTIGDGGFGMKLTEIETCVRQKIHFVTVVFNDNSLSLIRVSQENKGYQNYGVDYGAVNFAAAAEALGAWAQRVTSLDELEQVFRSGLGRDRPVVIEVPIDLREYRAHNSPTVAVAQTQSR